MVAEIIPLIGWLAAIGLLIVIGIAAWRD